MFASLMNRFGPVFNSREKIMEAQRKCGYKRPRRRIEGSTKNFANVRSKECTLHQSKSGAYALVPVLRLNPSLSKDPILLCSSEKNDPVYLRYWRMAHRPNGGTKLRQVDVRLQKQNK